MPRDNFTPKEIEPLKKRVNLLCSNPDCRVPTHAPSSKSNDAINNIGKAAHICAASKGGPRYDAEMTTKQRTSIDNAIWLCGNCADKIDRDVIAYPVELLKQWKIQAEQHAKNEQGKKQPRNEDAIDAVTLALTGLPKRPLDNAINNLLTAPEKALEAIDPRFEIKLAYRESITHFTINAKETVPGEIIINQEYANEFSEKIRASIEHGEDVTIDACAVQFTGSPLFDFIFGSGEQGNLIISRDNKIQAVLKLRIKNPETDEIFIFDDIIGLITGGTKSITFSGTACKDLFNAQLKASLDILNNNTEVSFNIATKKWQSLDVSVHLPL